MALQLTQLRIPNMTTDYSAETNAAAGLAKTIAGIPAEWRKQQEAAQTKQLLGSIGQDFQSGNYDNAAAKFATLGDLGSAVSVLGLGQKRKELQQREEADRNSPFNTGSGSPSALGATPSGAAKMPPAEVKAIIDRTVPEADREYAYRMAEKESRFDPNAVSPTGAKGLFQFTGGTGRQYGLIDRAGDLRANPEANTQAFVRFTEDNRKTLRNALGREPTYGELALAHQQGAGGALALITGKGDIDPNNLRVNNADPSAPRSQTAQRIMAYYGYGGQQGGAARPPAQVAQASQPSQATPQGAAPVAPIPGDDPVKLRQEAQFYAQTNPEAARQLSARADAAERGAGVQTAQAPAQPGSPLADVPAQGASPVQDQPGGFRVPGTASLPPNDPYPQVSTQRLVEVIRNKNSSEGDKTLALKIYNDRQAYAAETAPEKREQARLATDKARLEVKKLEREIEGEGGRPMTPQERAAFNVREGQPAWIKRNGDPAFGPAATQINNTNAFDAKGESKFNEALGAAQAKRWNGYIEEGDIAQNRLADIQTLRETSRRLGSQGSSANLKALVGPYAESLGIQVEGLGDIQLYESITNRLAPTLRAPGSGSTSDIEFKGFQRAIGPLSNNPAAREMILDTFEAASRNDVARSEIASRLAAGEINRGQAEKELRALPNPLENFRKFREANPDLVGQAIKETGQRAALEKNGPPKISSPEQAAKLPSGTEFIDPNGIKRRVP